MMRAAIDQKKSVEALWWWKWPESELARTFHPFFATETGNAVGVFCLVFFVFAVVCFGWGRLLFGWVVLLRVCWSCLCRTCVARSPRSFALGQGNSFWSLADALARIIPIPASAASVQVIVFFVHGLPVSLRSAAAREKTKDPRLNKLLFNLWLVAFQSLARWRTFHFFLPSRFPAAWLRRMMAVLASVRVWESHQHLSWWIEHVLSQSNPADLASKCGEAERVEVECWETWCLLAEVA